MRICPAFALTRGALVLGVSASFTGGCMGPCDGVAISSTSPANLTVTQSLPYTAIEEDAGREAVYGIQDLAITSVMTSFHNSGAMNPVANPNQCINVSTPIEIFLACPPDAGQFQLSALGATACDPDSICASLNGTLTVRSVALPCGLGACGDLDADLDVTASEGAIGPFVSGSATLSYHETKITSVCGGLSDG
jgi:hypothetical protein